MTQTPQAVVPYLRYASDDGHPYLQGCRCGACGAVFVDLRDNCPACAARGAMEPVELGTIGKLYNYTIVYRSFPGVTVPFISAVVDLEGGGTVKGNLLGVPADPEAIAFDLPVKVIFADAGRANPAGEGYLSHFFVPLEGGA